MNQNKLFLIVAMSVLLGCSEKSRYQLDVKANRDEQYIIDTYTGNIRILNLKYGDTNVYHCDYNYSNNSMSGEHMNGVLLK